MHVAHSARRFKRRASGHLPAIAGGLPGNCRLGGSRVGCPRRAPVPLPKPFSRPHPEAWAGGGRRRRRPADRRTGGAGGHRAPPAVAAFRGACAPMNALRASLLSAAAIGSGLGRAGGLGAEHQFRRPPDRLPVGEHRRHAARRLVRHVAGHGQAAGVGAAGRPAQPRAARRAVQGPGEPAQRRPPPDGSPPPTPVRAQGRDAWPRWARPRA